jgi:hypothetical protein
VGGAWMELVGDFDFVPAINAILFEIIDIIYSNYLFFNLLNRLLFWFEETCLQTKKYCFCNIYFFSGLLYFFFNFFF